MIRIGKQPFKVLGVMASKGQGMGEDMDDQILTPYTTVQKKLLGITHVNNITVSAASADDTSGVADGIAAAAADAPRDRAGPGRRLHDPDARGDRQRPQRRRRAR